MDLFFMITFVISWIIWFILADKSRWREILPVCVLASGLGMLTDDLTEHAIMYWEYFGEEPKWVVEIADDLGIYVVVTYLFIQWLPKEKTLPNMLPYWFIWTGLSITIEYIHIVTGHMTHQYGWNYFYSYLSNWILFWIFYKFHASFNFSKLNN